MPKKTPQINKWTGSFGAEYTQRNTLPGMDDFERLYRERFGFTRHEMNQRFLGPLDRSIRIPEVGANTGQ